MNQETYKKIRKLIILAILLYLGVNHIDVVMNAVVWGLELIIPFIIGVGVAYVLNVPMRFVEKLLFGRVLRQAGRQPYIVVKPDEQESVKSGRGVRLACRLARPVSLVVTILLVLGAVLLISLIVIPELTSTIVSLTDKIPAFLENVQEWAEEMFRKYPEVVEKISAIEVNWTQMFNTVWDFLKNGAGGVLDSTVGMAVSIFSGAVNFMIGVTFACYILLQKEKLGRQATKVLRAFLPDRAVEKTLEVGRMSHKIFASFLTGQCLEAFILGMMFFVTMTIFRMPYAMLISVLIGFTALIPILGAFIGCVVACFLILMVSPIQMLAFLIMFFVLQQLEENLVYPHVVGNSVGLPSIWVLVAVTLGGNLMGISGMLLFIPLSSVLYTLFRGWVNQKVTDKNGLQFAVDSVMVETEQEKEETADERTE
ncbi:AI-2E family transporter [Cuneatibacter caecimuris]|uniref:Putative PurR-regulated permease PerM n=1 Tax=Cuneatibacter caecimuris TaxID=1796618 RepID=A0A4V2F7P0_9FIRM|nr:AI-2E family transporter [Cuneatibacter caecimuris]RZT00490.1 putative PurR-regulated permease PerM [Cuneatibacter caecimuris]